MKKGAYGIVYQEIMRSPDLPGNAKLIYAYLASFAGKEDECYPSVETICAELNMSKTTMYKYMNALVDCGVIEKKQTYVGNIKSRVIYRITHEINKNVGFPKKSETEKITCSDSENLGFREIGISTDSETNINNTNINNINNNNKRGNRRFTPPTLEDVKAYCQERNNQVDPERFLDFYSAKGWMIGKNKMKDWKAAVRTWERKDATRQQEPTKLSPEERQRRREEERRREEQEQREWEEAYHKRQEERAKLPYDPNMPFR
mgnify:CR=1 FL=1|jgi:hypothetical protein|uniref:Helix-turn-helix domain protein n=1 Tax=Siphoviridae sp. ct5kv15 TaxID=2825338 RepID=A0A8S5PM15_9CAUD|nr:MAG TPA: helix-turn-helix domain protein [Siphoviridae sp. ct5kv15]